MRLLPLACMLLTLSSSIFNNVRYGDLLSYQDCAGNVICLVQKSCLVPESTEFHTLIRWSGKMRGNLTNCTGIRISDISMDIDEKYSFRVQLQTRFKMSEAATATYYAGFLHDFKDGLLFECESDKQINNVTFSVFDELKLNISTFSYSADGRYGENSILCDLMIEFKLSKTGKFPKFQTRMRIKTQDEFFTYENDDFWEMFEEIISTGPGQPLTMQFIHYCILILLVYSITVYFLDRYCRQLQFTTIDREEMEEHFFPPARYRNKLHHFRMLREQTKIEKEKNLAAVPEDILIDFEN